jgi:23S rRNA (guanosine2251-2'-O)-methyltransferase
MENIETVVAGKRAVLEYLQRSPEKIDSVLVQDNRRKDVGAVLDLCRKTGVRFQFVPKGKLDQETEAAHQGVAARIYEPGYSDPDHLLRSLETARFPVLLALDQLQDSGNIGTLARTLFAFGGAGVVLPVNRTAFLGGRAQKTAAGALGKLPVARVNNLARFLRSCRDSLCHTLYAGTGPACGDIFAARPSWPLVLVLGNEERGVRPGVAKECDRGVTIPMPGAFDSLNVAQAGAVILGQLLRQRLAETQTGP